MVSPAPANPLILLPTFVEKFPDEYSTKAQYDTGDAGDGEREGERVGGERCVGGSGWDTVGDGGGEGGGGSLSLLQLESSISFVSANVQ